MAMSDEQGPWTDYAPPPVQAPAPAKDTKPWEDYGPSANASTPTQPEQGVMGAVGAALQAQPRMMADAMTNPVTQAKALPYLTTALGGIAGTTYGGMQGMKFGASIGNIGGNALADAALASYGKSDEIPSVPGQVAQGILSVGADAIPAITKVPDSLKNAGVNLSTLNHMYPGGQPPGEWVQAVENQLKSNGVLGKTANATWKMIQPELQEGMQNISNIMTKVEQATPDALMVDAKEALAPIADEAKKFGTGYLSASKTAAEPYVEMVNGLMKDAQQQGGKLSLQNMEKALDEVGGLMNGSESAREEFGPLYGKIANARDGIVQTVANQIGDPGLKSALLENNANVSTYLRLLPSIERSGIKEAVKEGISAYQKYGGPLITKVAAGVGIYDELHKAVGKVLGSD